MKKLQKRMLTLYCLLLSAAAGLFFGLYYLTSGDALSTAAKTQSSYTLHIPDERGTIYDRAMRRMTNVEERYIAAVMPCPEALTELSETLSGPERLEMIERFQDNRPFLLEVDTPFLYAYGVDVFRTTERYQDPQPAAHIVGHLQDGKGAYGIEKAYDSILASCGSKAQVSYTVDLRGSPLLNVPPDIRQDLSAQGVVLTIDEEIQRMAEEVASYYIRRGAIVVMDVQNGDILASVSLPSFSPSDVQSALEAEGQPFVNRVMSAYNVGSTFKLAVAACALESGITPGFGYECRGAVEIDGVEFHCHNLAGHGWLTMQRAIEQSCNPYFINLGQRLDPDRLYTLCQAIGFSRQTRLAPQMLTAAGTMPSAEDLQNRPTRANFSFGQGSLTATPLQIAQLVSMIANGGRAVTPRLVMGSTLDGETIDQENPNLDAVPIISPATAAALREMMISTVEQGSGWGARPSFGSAGGKTASAQTWTYREDGSEIVLSWFSGFYPAQSPKYAIVVLNEEGGSGGIAAAPVFRGVANGIAELAK